MEPNKIILDKTGLHCSMDCTLCNSQVNRCLKESTALEVVYHTTGPRKFDVMACLDQMLPEKLEEE